MSVYLCVREYNYKEKFALFTEPSKQNSLEYKKKKLKQCVNKTKTPYNDDYYSVCPPPLRPQFTTQ